MAVSDTQRHSLGQRAREVLGKKEGATLMEMLPPVGWADVATKQDLKLLETSLRGEIRGEINRLIMWLVPMNIGLAFAAARLA